MEIFFWCLVAYVVIGFSLAIAFYQPEGGGWLWQILLWPLWLLAMFVHR